MADKKFTKEMLEFGQQIRTGIYDPCCIGIIVVRSTGKPKDNTIINVEREVDYVLSDPLSNNKSVNESMLCITCQALIDLAKDLEESIIERLGITRQEYRDMVKPALKK